MKFQFLGCGSAFTNQKYFQSNMLFIADSGKKLLLDCGGDVRFSLWDAGYNYQDIDAVYISHLHADHVGGMEWLALSKFFSKGLRPSLYCVSGLMEELWESSLKGGLETIEGQLANLTTYFDCKPIKLNDSFIWEGYTFTPVQMVHVMSGYKIQHSYGLIVCSAVEQESEKIFITTDTQFCPNQISNFYKGADIIFQDCETAPFKSGVHAHYSDLKTLAPEIKRKMWLYHYQPEPSQNAVEDGFAGFAHKGQMFNFKKDVK